MRSANRPLTAGWVAGSVRARHLLQRRLGAGAARRLAASASLGEALERLSGTAYGRRCRPGLDLAGAQRAVAETALWHIRVLAGWVPPRALEPVRSLAAWFEIANVDDRLAYLEGAEMSTPFAMGGLATAWPRLAAVQSAAEVSGGLTGTAWGSPGTADPSAIRLALRLAWARRVLVSVEDAADWAAGAVALLIARERFLADHPAEVLSELRVPGVGTAWAAAADLGELRAALPPRAAWALEGASEPAELWRQEAAWWRRVEDDAERLVRDPHMGQRAVTGCVVLLGVDARRTAGALEAAARGGRPDALEVFDDVA